MARITYDDQTAAAYKAVRELPRDGLGEWRDAIRRHLGPLPGMIVADIGADALEPVPETWTTSLAEFLAQADTFRRADSTIHNLTEEEFLRGKERLRRAVRDAEETPSPDPRTSWFDLLVLR